MFVTGKVYNRRRDIHAIYSGQQQGGICTPSNHPVIFIFTGDSGDEFGYKDDWTAAGIFEYTGEGQVGDMQITKGNKAIRDHVQNGKDLYLFKYIKSGHVQFIGNMVYTGHHFRDSKDRNGDIRKAIVFELAPAEFAREEEAKSEDTPINLSGKSLDELRNLAAQSSEGYRTVEEKKKVVRIRSAAVKEYALKRADGICECCDNPAPFKKSNGDPYLEVHHIKRLSDGGPDKPEWVAAVCPNCHGEAHHGEHKVDVRNKLLRKISEKERAIR